ncbi:ABC transporter substrate-binding protein [Bradyrhizobium iriomotense]|uniref:ABC transporter substrate-binding protein n=1 Tax=Bradyrhizobium iriomotense TaxID=441950 RepID=UPI001B89DD19|nr:ABC transporter substrate-binding protein [Bradyrhizobium iriomotense]MBR0784775.1 ABC transporter substrate-binding protein [Bradyrhizobium iriomotense]
MQITRKAFLKSIAALCVAPMAGVPARAEGGGEILVGATVPMTGPLSLTGLQYLNSLRLAEENINKTGGINGRKLKIVFEDTQGSNSTAVNAYVKLAQETKPAFFFLSSYSTQNLAVSPEVKKVQVPAMYAGGADAIAEGGNDWMFRLRPTDSVAAAGMVACVTTVLKARKVGILYIQNDFGQGGAASAVKALEAQSVVVVGREAYGQTDKDFSAQIINLRNKGAEAVLLFNYPQDGALVLRQYKALGMKAPLVGSSSLYVTATMQLLSPADLENTFCVLDTLVDPAMSPRMKDFIEQYRAKFGNDPDPYGLAYYDGAFLMADAMRQAGLDPAALQKWLLTQKSWDGIGHNYAYDSKGNGVHEVVIVKTKAGSKALELVKKVTLS